MNEISQFFDGKSWNREAVIAAQQRRALSELAAVRRGPRAEDLLSDPLSSESVEHFEQQCRIKLPSEYRAFLLQIGDGGIGPGLYVRRLGAPIRDVDNNNWEPGEIFPDPLYSSLDTPFPYSQAVEGGYGDLEEEFESGALHLFDYGCAIWALLIVSGESFGQIWIDSRTDNSGLYPATTKEGKPAMLPWRSGLVFTVSSTLSLLPNPCYRCTTVTFGRWFFANTIQPI